MTIASLQRIQFLASVPRFGALVVLACGVLLSPHGRLAEAAVNVVLWDTTSRVTDPSELVDRSKWKAVPSDLFALEADPAKAASDPGYYGRPYAFMGDAIVANRNVSAVFWSAKGRVVLYSRVNGEAGTNDFYTDSNLGRKILEFAPRQTWGQPSTIIRCDIVRNASDEVVLEATFSAKGASDIKALFSFGKSEIVQITPSKKMDGVRLFGEIEYGAVPSFIGDDLVVTPGNHSSDGTLYLPSENLFLGLLKGADAMLVMTWPKGKQRIRLELGKGAGGLREIQSLDFDHDGRSFYLAAVQSPGVWHREVLKPAYLEKDVQIAWKRPFPAKWKTQLSESGVNTTFTFRAAKAQIWRGVPGSYTYPVWFEGDATFFHLSKKVPPKGESIIYFLEGDQTPSSQTTPSDILKATLGRQMADDLLDVPGRRLRTHHRESGSGVHRGCTCGYTEAIQVVFEKGEEIAKKAYIAEALEDMVYFVKCHLDRIDEYRFFASGLITFLRASVSASPELKIYADSLVKIAEQIGDKYQVQLENMKSMAYAEELTRRTKALTTKKDAQNLAAFMELLKEWRAMGGAQDYIVAECHAITRMLYQAAGSSCLNLPKAVGLAEEVRQRTRQCLRNPDGYEIWPEY